MPPSAAPAWTILYQQPKVGLVRGQAVDGYEVGFKTAKDVHDHVFIPRANYNPDAVKAAVAAQAATLDAIHGLTG